MSTHSVQATVITTSALTLAALEANALLALGFLFAGSFGALVGHAKLVLERELQRLERLSFRMHICHLVRGLLLAEFVCFLYFLVWFEMGWPWAWGLFLASVSSVFSNETIDLAWKHVRGKLVSLGKGRP